MHAHWGWIQPEPKLRVALHDIHFKKLDNPGLGPVTGSALQQMCCQTLSNLKRAVYPPIHGPLIFKDSAIQCFVI